MAYLTAKEAAAQWGVTLRTVQKYCINGRIEGAKKHANNWLLPENCQKPLDPRRARREGKTVQPHYVLYAVEPWPRSNPDRVLQMRGEPYRSLTAASLSTQRGEYEPAKACWQRTKPSDATMLTTALLSGAASISSGDFLLYHEIRGVLEECIAQATSERDIALLSLPNVLVYVNMTLPDRTPEWLKQADFSLFPRELRPFLAYLYALHLRNIGDHRGVRSVTRITLALMEQEDSFTWTEIYLHLLYAAACYLLGEMEEARESLRGALRLGMPHGLIAPYAEYLAGFGGMMENLLTREYPQQLKPVTALWKQVTGNWHAFRNELTQEHITTLLTPQEQHAALLFARGMTYRQTAQTLHLSVGRVKGLISAVYVKLGVSGREALKKHLLTY